MANMHLVTGYAGKTHVTAADHGAFWAAVVGDGEYILDTGEKFAASIITNNQIRISGGEMLIQGRHCRIPTGETVDLTIENGTAGMQRKDLIVARYTKSTETGVEEMNLVVLRGVEAESNPATPEYITGNIFAGDTLHDFPLYEVGITDVDVTNITPLFSETVLSLQNYTALAKPQEGSGAPTDSTIGAIGSAYIDTSVTPPGYYLCFGVSNGKYEWIRMGYMAKSLKTEVITSSTTWVVPENFVATEDVHIMVFGGGGGGGIYGGGGGGYMGRYTGKLSGKSYVITIGAGGAAAATGGTGGVTSFGTLISASGGSGGGPYASPSGGNGGSGGGGGAAGDSASSGGNGAYGGGGGGGYRGNGGNGGTYGGGGGGGGGYGTGTSSKGSNGGNSQSYSGGIANNKGGGGGGGYSAAGESTSNSVGGAGGAGVNTTGTNENFTGKGTAGANGSVAASASKGSGGGGGGGYGGNGGNGAATTDMNGGGGGGGYGASGGNGAIAAGGGGGGYGGNGKDATDNGGGGGGGYGDANYASGGNGTAKTGSVGTAGVCIIQYYVYD